MTGFLRRSVLLTAALAVILTAAAAAGWVIGR